MVHTKMDVHRVRHLITASQSPPSFLLCYDTDAHDNGTNERKVHFYPSFLPRCDAAAANNNVAFQVEGVEGRVTRHRRSIAALFPF